MIWGLHFLLSKMDYKTSPAQNLGDDGMSWLWNNLKNIKLQLLLSGGILILAKSDLFIQQKYINAY